MTNISYSIYSPILPSLHLGKQAINSFTFSHSHTKLFQVTKSFIDSRSYSSSGLLTTLQIIWILWIFWTPLVALKHLKPHIGFQQNNLILLISFLIQDLCQSVGQSLIVSDWRALRACSCKGSQLPPDPQFF